MQAGWIGWFASAILLITLARQVHVQWTEKSTAGVSALLFAGQLVASIGFVTYSYLSGDTIFILTKSAILVTSLIGQGVYFRNKRLDEGDSAKK